MSQSNVRLLSSMSKLPEAELARRLDQLKDPSTGKVRGLSALDAALAGSAAGVKQTTLDAYDALSSRAQTSHVIEDPSHAVVRASVTTGYADNAVEKASPQMKNVLDAASKSGVKRAQQSGLLNDDGLDPSVLRLPDQRPSSNAGEPADADSRQMLFEQMKNEMNKISQITQMITNTMNTMHDQAMAAIRNSKA